MRKFFITGDSHVAALQRGESLLRERGGIPRGVALHFKPFGNAAFLRTPFFEAHADRLEITEASYRRRVPQLPAEGFPPQDTIYAVSAFFHYGALWVPALWRQSWVAGMPAGRGRAFSAGMIRETVLFRMRYLLQFAAAMRDFGCTVCALESRVQPCTSSDAVTHSSS